MRYTLVPGQTVDTDDLHPRADTGAVWIATDLQVTPGDGPNRPSRVLIVS